MIIVAVFSIYERPVQGGGSHINLTGFLVGAVSTILTLVVVYQLFMGIKEMAQHRGKMDLYEEVGTRWTQFLVLQLAAILLIVLIFIPPLAIICMIGLLAAAIILTVFMSRCGEGLS